MKSIWEKVKADLKAQIPANNYMMWIDPMEVGASGDDHIVLKCPNHFSKKWVEGYYREMIESGFTGMCGKSIRVACEVANGQSRCEAGDEAVTAKAAQTGKKTRKADKQLTLPNSYVRPRTGRLLKDDFTFDTFVVGNNNDFAYSAVLSMGSQKNAVNRSLFLTSKPGMGKSHLTQALGHYTLGTMPAARVYYITAEDFSNEMVYAFNTKTINQFKDKYRAGFDVLLLDDIHSLAGKERTQTELAMVLDYMLEADKKVLFTGCCLPGEIPKINEQLKSRLSCGLITTMDLPDFRTRVRILRKKSRLHGYSIPDEVIEYLADNLTDDIRQLESGLTGVAMKSSLLGVPVDLDLARSIVKNMVIQQRKITLDLIKKMVCKEYGVLVKDIDSRSRQQRIAWPRQVAIYLSRRLTDHSLKSIGRNYNRYHATVIHSINAVENAMKQKESTGQEVSYLLKKIEDGKFTN
ncbi:MAG: chromosomal replication initiator protein DnaA [Thermodesulfobacteriota bacterium]|nr:chromosomal replication initiator protein DnaA [Thermodesulfobacteriota bacterium]